MEDHYHKENTMSDKTKPETTETPATETTEVPETTETEARTFLVKYKTTIKTADGVITTAVASYQMNLYSDEEDYELESDDYETIETLYGESVIIDA